MQIHGNKVKQILGSGGTVYSSSVRLPAPGLCEILGYAGFDFVLLDSEHGAIDAGVLDSLVQSCFAGDTVPIIRVLRNDDPEAVMHVLDLGVQGVLIPHCRTVDDAQALQQSSFYPPRGVRGFGPGRGAKWGRVSGRDYFESINDSIVLMALIEDVEGVDNIEQIATTGLDVLWVGTGDLALGYGVPGERDHPKVVDAANRVLDACQRNDVAAGYPVRNAEEAAWAREQGYRVIGFASAEQYIMQHARMFLKAVGR